MDFPKDPPDTLPADFKFEESDTLPADFDFGDLKKKPSGEPSSSFAEAVGQNTPTTKSDTEVPFISKDQVKRNNQKALQINNSDVIKKNLVSDFSANPNPAYQKAYLNTLEKIGYDKDKLNMFWGANQTPADNPDLQNVVTEPPPEGTGNMFDEAANGVVSGLKQLAKGAQQTDPMYAYIKSGGDVKKTLGEIGTGYLNVAAGGAKSAFSGGTFFVPELTAFTAATKAATSVPDDAKKAIVSVINPSSDVLSDKEKTEAYDKAISLPFSLATSTAELLYKPKNDAIDLKISQLQAEQQNAPEEEQQKYVKAIDDLEHQRPMQDGSAEKAAYEILDLMFPVIAHKTGSIIKSAKDFKERITKVAENKATPQEKQEVAEVIKEVPNVTLDDIQQEKEIVNKNVPAEHHEPLHNAVADLKETVESPAFEKVPPDIQSPVIELYDKAKEDLKKNMEADATSHREDAHIEGDIAQTQELIDNPETQPIVKKVAEEKVKQLEQVKLQKREFSQKDLAEIPEEETPVEEKKTGELKLTDKTKDVLDEVTDEKTGEKKYQDFSIDFEDGARAYGRIEDGVASIAGIEAPKENGNTKRGTKTYERVLAKLKEKGIDTVKIKLQSNDSAKAIDKLVEKGVLSNPRDVTGSSGNERATKFDISDSSGDHVPTQEEIDHSYAQRAHELAELRKSQPKSYKEQIIHDNIGRVKRSDVEHYNDKNNLATKDDKNTWSGENLNMFSKKSLALDTQAQQLSELAGIEITPNDIADYIIDLKNNPEKYHKQESQKLNEAKKIPIKVADVIAEFKDDYDMNNPDVIESLRHFPLLPGEADAILKYLKDEYGKEPAATNSKPSKSPKLRNETKGQSNETQSGTGTKEPVTPRPELAEEKRMAASTEGKPLTVDDKIAELKKKRAESKQPGGSGYAASGFAKIVVEDLPYYTELAKLYIEKYAKEFKDNVSEFYKKVRKEDADLNELSDKDLAYLFEKTMATDKDFKEGFTGLAKANITDAEGVVLNFDKPEQRHWTTVTAEAISDLEKKAESTNPDDMFNAAQAEIDDMAKRQNYNPTDKDYATMLYHRVRLMDKLKTASEQMLNPDKNIQKLGQANYELYNELLKQNSDLVAAKRTVSARSLSILGAVAKMDAKSGLDIKRMQVIKAKGNQWLTAKEEADLQAQHDTEIANAKSEVERLKKNFQHELKRQVDIEVQKLKSKGAPKDRTAISQASKRWASNVRKLKIPKEYTGVRFDAGSWDLVVDAVANAIETTGDIAQAIKNTLDDLKLKYTDNDINNLVGKFKDADKQNILDKIKDLSDEEGINTITKQSVAKNHIRELVRANIEKGFKGDDILDQTHKDLQTIFPDMTREEMNDAFLKRGDFKLESKETVLTGTKKIEKDLLEKTRLEKNLKDLEDNKEKEKAKIHEKSTDPEVLKVKKQIEDLKTKRKEAADAKKKFETELAKAGKEITDDLSKQKKSELEKAQNELDRRFNKEIADAEKLAAKQKEAELKRIAKAKERELNKIAAELEKEYKQKNKTELEKLQNELDRRADKLAEYEQKIKDLQNGKVWNKKNNATAKVDVHIAKAKEELAKLVNKKKIKLERGNKLDLPDKKAYAERHNQRINDLYDLIDKHITDENRDELDAIKKLLDTKAKVNVDSAEELFSAVEKTKQITDTIRESLQGKPEYDEIRKAIDDMNVERVQDFYDTEQKLKLAQYKHNAENAIKKNNKILERGEVIEPNSARPDMLDADAIRLDIAKQRSAMQVQKIIQKAARDKMSKTEKVIDFVMRSWVAQLVGNIKTGLVVGASALSKQPMETFTRATTGQIAPRLFSNLSHGAGAESATGFLRQERERYRAHYGAMSEGKLQERIAKSQQNLTNADIAYENAKERAKELQGDYDKYMPLVPKGGKWTGIDEYNNRRKAVAEAKQAQIGATLDYLSNSIYQWIGSNSYKDAGEVFLHGTAKLEELLGKDAKEYFKDKDGAEKVLYVFNMMAATHGMMKNFSARGQFAAEFMARMENKVKAGVDVRSPDEIIKTIAESYISFERGKFQQDNMTVSFFNNIMRSVDKWQYKGKDGQYKDIPIANAIAKAYLKSKQPVLRTSTNIASEAVLDYTLGGILAPIMHTKEFLKGGKNGIQEGDVKSLSDFVSKGREYIKDLPPEKKDAILRAYRKGGFAALGYALAATGVIQFGGFWTNPGNDKEKGKIKVFGEELNPLLTKIIMHSPFMMPSLMWANAQKIAEKDGGLSSLKASIDAATETLPFAGESKHAPFYQGLTVPTIGNITKGVGEMYDNDGTSIFSPVKRTPDSFMDWVKMNSGFNRSDVNTQEVGNELKKNEREGAKEEYKKKHLMEVLDKEDADKKANFEKELRLSANPKVQKSRSELLLKK